jgi:hypothetical protein
LEHDEELDLVSLEECIYAEAGAGNVDGSSETK